MKPKGIEVYLVYECPKCNAQHTTSREETIFPGGVLCWCGEKIEFEPISTITAQIHYSTKKYIKKEKEVSVSPNRDDLIIGLVNLGYNKAYLQKRVKELGNISEEEILRIITTEKIK